MAGRFCLAVALVCGPASAMAQPVDKRQYHLFNPTPRAEMRPLAPEPSPRTIDAGRFQLEAGVLATPLERVHLRSADERIRSMRIEAALRVGLLHDLEFQWIVHPIRWERSRDPETGRRETRSGFGDMTLVLKWNWWGNDQNEDGDTALGILGSITLPTSGERVGTKKVEGGAMLPFSVLFDPWEVVLVPGLHAVWDDERGRHTGEAIGLANIGWNIAGDLAGYVELFSAVDVRRSSPWVVSFGGGLTYDFDENAQLDVGALFGLTRAAPGFEPYIVLVRRF